MPAFPAIPSRITGTPSPPAGGREQDSARGPRRSGSMDGLVGECSKSITAWTRPAPSGCLLGDDDVAALLELVAFHELGVRYLALAVWAPAHLLNAGLALGVKLVRRQRRRRLGRGKHLDRDGDRLTLMSPPSRSHSRMSEHYRCNRFVGARGSRSSSVAQMESFSSRVPRFNPAPPNVDLVGLDPVQGRAPSFAV